MSQVTSRRDFLATAAKWGSALVLARANTVFAKGTAQSEVQNALIQLDPVIVRKFVNSLDGHAIGPNDDNYDLARQVWNAAIDKHPGLIVICSGPADVARTIEFAQRRNVVFAVRSGGHSLAGKSTCDGGIVLDMSALKDINVDPARRLARAGAGLTLAEFDRASQAQGLATTSGTEPSTGITGLTMGGGLGWLMGKYGLACDNLRSVDIVLADGRQLKADGVTNPDLYWAVRGAGANFGVVTTLEYDLHPVSTILGGVIKYPLDSLRDVLKRYRDFTVTIPDEVGISVGMIPTHDGKAVASAAVSYCGDLHEGEKALLPLRSAPGVLSDSIKPMPYLDFQRLGGLPPGLRLHAFVRSSFITDLSDAAIDVIAEQAAMAPPFSGSFVMECVHGKVARTPVDATAFPHRMMGHNFSLHGDWIAPADEKSARQWVTDSWNAMQPFLRPAVYSNYLDDEGPERSRASYGANYERLAVLKRRYDPDNFFRLNQNIAPAM
jgi:FAD/FMN-containing dehydrogenase